MNKEFETIKKNLEGKWISTELEFNELAKNYSFKTLILNPDTSWSIKVESFADEAKTTPLFTMVVEGDSYEITEESSVVSGSYNATFPFSKKYFTAFIDPKMLGLGDCGLEIGVEKDVSDINYGWLVSIENCSADYDLVTFEGETVSFGKRNPNMCTAEGRPTEKGEAMKKVIS